MIDLPDREGATLVRGGDERDVSRLCRLGGRVIERGEQQDSAGMLWGYALVRLGKRRLLVLLGSAAPCNDGPA